MSSEERAETSIPFKADFNYAEFRFLDYASSARNDAADNYFSAMKTDLKEVEETLRGILKLHVPTLRVRKDEPNVLELCGKKEVMQGKQKVDGFYFGSVVPKPKDVRLYYFPIYTHPTEFSLSDELRKALKGKSCFHIKKLSPEMEKEIGEMVKKGVEVYDEGGLI